MSMLGLCEMVKARRDGPGTSKGGSLRLKLGEAPWFCQMFCKAN